MSGRVGAVGGRYNSTSSAVAYHTVEAMMEAEALRSGSPAAQPFDQDLREPELERPRIALKTKAEARVFSGVSVFAVLGTVLIGALMVLVILAQITHNEMAIETARLSVEVRELAETHRALSLAFESSINIGEIERIARDELGMSRPDAIQVITLNTLPSDRAFVVDQEYEDDRNGFLTFIFSLFDYFRAES